MDDWIVEALFTWPRYDSGDERGQLVPPDLGYPAHVASREETFREQLRLLGLREWEIHDLWIAECLRYEERRQAFWAEQEQLKREIAAEHEKRLRHERPR